MFNKTLKIAAFSLLSVMTIASASASDLKQGEIVEVEGKIAKVYVGTANSIVKGQLLQINRLQATNSVLEGDPLYSYQEVGKVLVNGFSKSQYINVQITEGNLKRGDRVKISSLVTRNFPSQIVKKIIERIDIPETDEEYRLMLVIYPPGNLGRPHMHPVAGLNYIISGTAESKYEGEEIITYNAGDSYTDPANKKHLIFRNASQMKELRFLVAYRVKKSGVFAIPLN